MQHVTEKYGESCNRIICSSEEFNILKTAFRVEGIQVRRISEYAGKVECQIINPYKDHCWNNLKGDAIKEMAEDVLEIDS